MRTASQIRSEFLKYFEKNNHTIVESSALVPQNDPTLLFTNAGMVQFKDVFLGTDPRPYKRATTSQKCLRAGGKHNDLENVGFTARHHTFFEMLGNFSFGDYFKKDAIHFAWEFVTKIAGISKDQLYVSVFREDDEAALIWEKQESVSKDRIYRFDEKDNFWSMGETGPCGPCSEIYVDRGEKYGCGKSTCKLGCDCDRYMEIWNLVFMQFDRSADGKMTPLPKPSIDTGMGLERIAAVLQGADSNYDIDIFKTLIDDTRKLIHFKPGMKTAGAPAEVSLRVIADHCRATNFLIADGVLPSNEGRGYVLRRIMRRAIRHGKNLGVNDPFFYKMTESLVKIMGSAYPELKDKVDYLQSTIKLEEERFFATLEKGLHIFEEEASRAKNKSISGETAFKLYDTFGFPLDLTQVIAKERGLGVDEVEFNQKMEAQRERSRESWKGSGEEAVGGAFKLLQQKGLKTVFKGYDNLSTGGKVLALIEEGKEVAKTSTGSFAVVFDHTPFYAESGGQVGDKGKLQIGDKFSADVVDVQKPTGDFFVIFCENAQGNLKIGDNVEQHTAAANRAQIAKNHTATHMLHHALRKFLGPHVKQAGSLVTPDLLRFDFTHAKALTESEIESVENFINDSISRSEKVGSEEMEKDKAISKGAIAFFGDKYGSKVRVISVGDYSVELCGGTHVHSTGDIQLFKILNESGIAAGVRRIIAITGPSILKELREKDKLVRGIMQSMRASAPAEILPKIEKLQVAEKDLRKQIEQVARKSASGGVDAMLAAAVSVADGKFIRGTLDLPEDSSPAKALRDLADLIRSKVSKSVVALAAMDKSKGQSVLLIAVTKDWQEKFKAGDLIKKVAPIIDGSGGGKADLAQAGGKKANFNDAFDAIEKILSS